MKENFSRINDKDMEQFTLEWGINRKESFGMIEYMAFIRKTTVVLQSIVH